MAGIRPGKVFQGVKETDNLQVVPVPIEDSLPPEKLIETTGTFCTDILYFATFPLRFSVVH